MAYLHINLARKGEALVFMEIPLLPEFKCPKLPVSYTSRWVSMLLTLSFRLCMNLMFTLPFQYHWRQAVVLVHRFHSLRRAFIALLTYHCPRIN